jgi:hypothetical protein
MLIKKHICEPLEALKQLHKYIRKKDRLLAKEKFSNEKLLLFEKRIAQLKKVIQGLIRKQKLATTILVSLKPLHKLILIPYS